MSLVEVTPPAFITRAACLETNPAIFFPHSGASPAAGIAVCETCPVATECLTYALEFEAAHPGSRWGIYGGTTARQRRTMGARKAGA